MASRNIMPNAFGPRSSGRICSKHPGIEDGAKRPPGDWTMNRRQLLIKATGLATGAVVIATPTIVRAKTKLRLGYLHVVAVDGQIWTGLDRGAFEQQGIEFDLLELNTG